MLALVTLFAVLCVAYAQEDGRPLRAFFEPLEVPLVNVEVYVSDGEGRPVPGLTIENFQVFEDGEPVEVTHFYAAPPVASDAESRAPEAPASSVTDPTTPVESSIPENQNLYLVLYVDDTNLSPNRRTAAFNHLYGFFTEDLPPELKAMIVSYDGSVHIRQSFTSDPQLLKSALDNLREGASLAFRMEERMIINEMQSAANINSLTAGSDPRASDVADADRQEYQNRITTYAEAARDRTRHSVDTLKRFTRSLSGLPGRKAVFWVGDGIEMRPGERLFAVFDQVFGEAGRGGSGTRAFLQANRFDVRPQIKELVHYANSQRVSFFTLSSLEDRSLAGVSAETRGMPGGSGLEVLGNLAEEEAMMYMSGGTGGRPLANNPGLADQLVEVSVELASYYSLGYQPQHSGDGKYHTLRVEVNRDQARVRHREGYQDLGPTDRMADRTLTAAVLDVTDNRLGIEVEAQEFRPRDDGSFVVPIMVRVPIGQLVLLPGEKEHTGHISIHLVVQDERGGLSPVQRREYPVQVANDQLLNAVASQAGFVMGLIMREGSQKVAVGVRDEVAKTEATTTIEVNVGVEGS